MMTALLFAKRTLAESIGLSIKQVDLMFDNENQTVEEEILQEGISEIMIKPKSLADQIELTNKLGQLKDIEVKIDTGSPKFGGGGEEESKDEKTPLE